MIALIQRVTRAEVRVDGEMVGAIEDGIVALIGVRRGDTESSADRLLERILSYRIFRDAQDKMNLSLQETKGGLLLISQFTLAADTQKGTRASFTPAAAPDDALRLFDRLATRARASHSPVATGKFGATMQVSLTNDGPVTFWLESSSSASARPCGNSQPTRICE